MSAQTDRPRILVTRKLTEAAEQRLATRFDVQFNASDTPMSAEALTQAMRDFDALVPTVSDRITGEMLRTEGRRVRMIANVGVGFSNIDVATAQELGVAVSNTPDVLTDATADIALLLILASTRRAYAAEKTLRDGAWTGFSVVDGLGTSIQGKVLGIIGMGRIGQATAKRAAAGFGMEVVFYNRSDPGALSFPARRLDSIDAVMQAADVVSVHVPGGGAAPLVTAEHIAQMKPSAHLVNTARGDSIDQAALVAALQSGRIAGAGLDVFADEPHVPEALRAMDTVTLLPHVGSATQEVRTAMGLLAADNLEAFFAGRDLPCRVA
ncbi:2-hydroxyacid dehydrogenase [Pseudoponticoccus marisrubri]|uniref:D-glycerate dehydrogenase n=1 Tax=Pseudoponticoccus marisrubri TaxID=1685382 RepID=A0A0W7WHG9_9RHOB|nr:D-glycerate dehydrogenase [Pseudoponticoccus marisrubri]KUF10060.1 D-glycerate dehydrogenase [Pseudoponticoccus marisrubri]